MALDSAAFATEMAAFAGNAAITAAFPYIEARQVNVLQYEEFPLLAYWVERGAEDRQRGSDNDRGHEFVYRCLVAGRLGDGDAQDDVLGQLIKVVKDLADTLASANGVEFELEEWDTDSNAETGDGTKVWAAFDLVVRLDRPRGDY